MSVVPSSEQRGRRKITQTKRRGFLDALAAGWSVTHAATRAGVHRRRFYELRESDSEFAADWEQAYEAGTDVIRDEIRRRGVDGWEEPVFQRGELVGHIRKFSDTLLLAEARRRDPTYRDNARVEVTGAGGGPVEVNAGYVPPTLGDLVRLAQQIGAVDVIDGEASEVIAELETGS